MQHFAPDCLEVLSRIHRRRPSLQTRLVCQLKRLNGRIVLGSIYIVLALALHFWCCDWRLPRYEHSATEHRMISVPYKNQLVGFIHAGTIFQTESSSSGTLYDLESAAWWGIHVPVMLSFAGVLAILGPWVAKERQGFLRRRFRVLPVLQQRHKPAGLAYVLFLSLFLSGTAVVGASYIAAERITEFVRYEDDSHSVSATARNKWLEFEVFDLAKEGLTSDSNSYSSPSFLQSAINEVPEPGTTAMLAMAAATAALLGWWRRKRGK